MVEELDVLVFTLGLTEAWLSREDGAVFTLCPGVAGGVFDPSRHVFHNFSEAEVVADMTACIAALRQRNPKARVILTVSPVPLAATAQADMHVLVASFQAKSMLVAAAAKLAQTLPSVAYFPAYEIIMSRAFDAGSYFGPDRRSVTGAGVAHVMRVFAAAFAGLDAPPPPPAPAAPDQAGMSQIEALMQAQCDEAALDPG